MERIHFAKELENFRMTILKMAALSGQALKKAEKAYKERNAVLAEEVIKGDKQINQLELEIDRVSMRLLALEQPMAKDLRFIVGAGRISNELERIADQAVNIAERTQFLCRYPAMEPIPAMDDLMSIATTMVDKAVSSLAEMDPIKAAEIRRTDDQADLYTLEVLHTLIDRMAESAPDPEKRLVKIQLSIQTIIISRCLERVADLSVNIGEHVAFMVTGVNIKHQEIPSDMKA